MPLSDNQKDAVSKILGLPVDRQLHYLSAFFDNITSEMMPGIISEALGIPEAEVLQLDLIGPEGGPLPGHTIDFVPHHPEKRY